VALVGRRIRLHLPRNRRASSSRDRGVGIVKKLGRSYLSYNLVVDRFAEPRLQHLFAVKTGILGRSRSAGSGRNRFYLGRLTRSEVGLFPLPSYIACVVCNQAQVQFEFFSRTPGAQQLQGLHMRCAEKIWSVDGMKTA
jgi:hypothetical protein